ncbi:TPA: type II secretion system pilot lipoprotein GspS [Serratia odorifera]|nr:type II secretion system pilot lipoprotein GspS [Serratia odorifera]
MLSHYISWLLPVLFLTGCAQPANKYSPLVANQQIKQLSALVAGSHYLRQQCKIGNIPDEDRLLNTALASAQRRGWDTQAPAYALLAEQSRARYDELIAEDTAESRPCSRLHLLLIDFLHAARSSKTA